MRKRERGVTKDMDVVRNSKRGHHVKTEAQGNVRNEASTINWLPSVALSGRDKASQLTLSDDQMELYGCDGGFRMARATNGVHNGSYYWEALILEPRCENGHVRIGWSARQGELQAPVGYDKYSYGYRDVNGAKVHKCIRDDEYGESFGPGDVIGCLIKLDDSNPDANEIRFIKNGKDQGVAFQGKEISSSVYFPAISVYMKADVVVNFGPSWIVQPFGKDEENIMTGVNAVSELQPLSPDDRKIHNIRIGRLRKLLSSSTAPAEQGAVLGSENSTLNALETSALKPSH